MTKAKKLESVKNSTNQNTVLTINRCRFFSRRAQKYTLAYRAIDIQTEQGKSEVNMLHSFLERAMKAYKMHRSIADINVKWIWNVISTMKKVNVQEKKCVSD